MESLQHYFKLHGRKGVKYSIYFNLNCSLRYILTSLPNSFLLPDCCRWVDRFRCLELCSHVDAGVNVVVDVNHAAGDVLQ